MADKKKRARAIQILRTKKGARILPGMMLDGLPDAEVAMLVKDGFAAYLATPKKPAKPEAKEGD